MKRWFFTSVLSVGLLGMVWESTVQAQGYSPYFPQTMGYQGPGRPALSPYLDLTRGGNAAANYYLGTLPEINRRAVTTLQNAAIRDLEVPSNHLDPEMSPYSMAGRVLYRRRVMPLPLCITEGTTIFRTDRRRFGLRGGR